MIAHAALEAPHRGAEVLTSRASAQNDHTRHREGAYEKGAKTAIVFVGPAIRRAQTGLESRGSTPSQTEEAAPPEGGAA